LQLRFSSGVSPLSFGFCEMKHDLRARQTGAGIFTAVTGLGRIRIAVWCLFPDEELTALTDRYGGGHRLPL